MSARHSKLTKAAIITTDAMIDAEYAVKRIRRALADGLQPHDVPEIMGAVCEIEGNAAEIRAQMQVVATVEKDIQIARRVLNVGWEDLWDKRCVADARQVLEMTEAPNRLQAVEAQNEAA